MENINLNNTKPPKQESNVSLERLKANSSKAFNSAIRMVPLIFALASAPAFAKNEVYDLSANTPEVNAIYNKVEASKFSSENSLTDHVGKIEVSGIHFNKTEQNGNISNSLNYTVNTQSANVEGKGFIGSIYVTISEKADNGEKVIKNSCFVYKDEATFNKYKNDPDKLVKTLTDELFK